MQLFQLLCTLQTDNRSSLHITQHVSQTAYQHIGAADSFLTPEKNRCCDTAKLFKKCKKLRILVALLVLFVFPTNL